MTPDQLITFSHVAEHLNISRAATALHLSQPAVSGQLQALQTSFGEALYYRAGRGIALTPAGLRLLGVANQLRENMRQARDQRHTARTLQNGQLRIGASTTPASYLLPEAVAQFKKQYPGIDVQLLTGNTTEVLNRLADLDFAVIEGEVQSESIANHRAIEWQTDEVVAVLRHDHPFATLPFISLRALSDQALVMREDGSGVRNMVMKAFDAIDVRLTDYLELAGVEGVKQGVRAGLGVGFVSELSLKHENNELVGVPFKPSLLRMIRILLPPLERQSRGAQAFIEQLLATE